MKSTTTNQNNQNSESKQNESTTNTENSDKVHQCGNVGMCDFHHVFALFPFFVACECF